MLDTLSLFGLVLLISFAFGKFFQKIKLPYITGCIIAGVLFGPYVLQLMNNTQVQSLNILNNIAIGFIALIAGSEINLIDLKKGLTKTLLMIGLHCVFILSIFVLIVPQLSGLIPFFKHFNSAEILVTAAILGVIMIARSPSSIIAIIKETKAKGPYTQLALHITVVSDIVVVVLFSIAYSLGVSIYDGKAVSMLFIPSMILNLGMSIGLAVVFAFVLTQLFKVVKIKWIQLLFILGACYLLYPLQSIFHHIQIVPGQLLELEPILMGIWVGIFIRNMTSVHHEFEKGLQTMSTPIFTIFFTLTGLTLALSILSQLLFIAIIIFCLRFIGLFSGSVLGGILTGVRKKEYFYLPLAHITQAGVSIGLARSIQEINPEWGTAFYTMALSAIIITQFVGPIAFKFSLNDLGESENGESKAEQSFSYAS